MIVLLVCGGRKYQDHKSLYAQLDAAYAHYGDFMLLHGDCPDGADKFAELWAANNGVHSARVRARWAHRGKGAGPQRNGAMLALSRPTAVLAFGNQALGTRGPGTADMVRQAKEAGVQVFEFD